jgi:hypothetical protein
VRIYIGDVHFTAVLDVKAEAGHSDGFEVLAAKRAATDEEHLLFAELVLERFAEQRNLMVVAAAQRLAVRRRGELAVVRVRQLSISKGGERELQVEQ